MNKYFAFSLCFLLLVGCQSSVDEAAKEHAEDVLIWQELANYAGDGLSYWDLTIVGSIVANEEGADSPYKLADIRLQYKGKHNQIDLLSPKFAERFVCGKTCKNLNLYTGNEELGSSVLSDFFDVEEGRFFRFYGQLVNFNNKLQFYRDNSGKHFAGYMKTVVSSGEPQQSLEQFLQWFDSQLNDDLVTSFVENDYSRVIAIDSPFKNVVGKESKRFSEDSPARDWLQEGEEAQNYELTDVVSVDERTDDEQLRFDLIREQEQKLSTNFARSYNWQLAKEKEIKLGKLVCTFSDNVFGIADALGEKEVSIKLIGEARVFVDGLSQIPSSGYLYSEPVDFYYSENTNLISRDITDVALCNIDYIAG